MDTFKRRRRAVKEINIPTMEPQTFRNALLRLDLSQTDAARLFGFNPRTIRRFASGAARVPRVLQLALTYVEVVHDIEENPQNLKKWGLTS
jgi:hypothetical protein